MEKELKEANQTGRLPEWVVALPGMLDDLKAWHKLVASSGLITVPLWWRGVRSWVVDPENALLVLGIAVPVVCWYAMLISLARNRPSARFKRLIPKISEVTDLYYDRDERGRGGKCISLIGGLAVHLKALSIRCPAEPSSLGVELHAWIQFLSRLSALAELGDLCAARKLADEPL